MLVKKINPEWNPIETRGSKDLAVGDTIEITNPRELILAGDVEAVDENDMVISAYELYGVLDNGEKSEFEEWLAVKRQERLEKKLKSDSDDLKKEAETLKEAVKEEAAKQNAEVKEEVKVEVEPVKAKKGKK
jgi:aminopeptidase C